MIITEALQSNLPLRRQGTPSWISPSVDTLTLSKKDLLATDWEVQEKYIPLTKSQLDATWKLTEGHTQRFQEFCKLLGF